MSEGIRRDGGRREAGRALAKLGGNGAETSPRKDLIGSTHRGGSEYASRGDADVKRQRLEHEREETDKREDS